MEKSTKKYIQWNKKEKTIKNKIKSKNTPYYLDKTTCNTLNKPRIFNILKPRQYPMKQSRCT